MFRCFNCHLCVDRMLRHVVSMLPIVIQTLLATWKSLQQIPPEVVICQKCFLLLNQHCSNGIINAERDLGHTQVCLGCGCSVRRRVRFHTIKSNDQIIDTILSWDANNEVISTTSLVCHLCWMRANRHLSQDVIRNQPGTCDGAEVEDQPINFEELQMPQQAIPESPPLSLPENQQQGLVPSVATITLPHYKRAANTSRHCIFQGCANASGHLIPVHIKVMLLKQYHIYVPIQCRLCRNHLYANEWQLLVENTNMQNSFTPQQIEDLISIAETHADVINFENVHEMPNHICHYWTGLTVTEFLTLYGELSVLENHRNGKTYLAIYLIKLRTGDSDNRLSTLFNMPRSTLESYLKKMKSYIQEHCASLCWTTTCK